MKIRGASDSDYNAVMRLYMQFNEDRVKTGTGEAGYRYLEAGAPWSELLADEDCMTFVAEEKGVVVGFVTLRADAFNPFKKVGRMGEIDLIVVDERVRRKGVGRRLVEHSLKHLHGRGFTHVLLNVRVDNPATSFWSKMGFRKVSKTGFDRSDGAKETIVYMVRSVS